MAPKTPAKKASKKKPPSNKAETPSKAPKGNSTKQANLSALKSDLGPSRLDRLWLAIASAWSLRNAKNWTENPSGPGGETVGDAARYHAARLDNTASPKGRAAKPQSFTTWAGFVAQLLTELDEGFASKAKPHSLLAVSPYHVTVITDTSHPLYDRRVEEAIDAEMLASITQFHGPHTPPQTTIWGDEKGTSLVITDGRRRILHVWAANEKIAVAAFLLTGGDGLPLTGERAKQPLIRSIEIVVKGRDLKEAIAVSGAANFNRRDESPMNTARKLAAEHKYTNASMSAMAESRGITRQTVANYMSLLKLAEPLQALMDKDELPFKVGLLLAGADHATQILALKKTADIAKWSVRAKAIKAHIEGVPWTPETAAHRPPTPRQVKAAIEALTQQKGNPEAETGLLYLRALSLGDPEAMAALPEAVRNSFAGEPATGALEQPCPKCKAAVGEPCLTAASDKASQWCTDGFNHKVHKARQKAHERELSIPASPAADDGYPPAMGVTCPKCDAAPGEYCLSDESEEEQWSTQDNTRVHTVRLEATEGKAEAA